MHMAMYFFSHESKCDSILKTPGCGRIILDNVHISLSCNSFTDRADQTSVTLKYVKPWYLLYIFLNLLRDTGNKTKSFRHNMRWKWGGLVLKFDKIMQMVV